jgi:hypothetical protein
MTLNEMNGMILPITKLAPNDSRRHSIRGTYLIFFGFYTTHSYDREMPIFFPFHFDAFSLNILDMRGFKSISVAADNLPLMVATFCNCPKMWPITPATKWCSFGN